MNPKEFAFYAAAAAVGFFVVGLIYYYLSDTPLIEQSREGVTD